MSCSVLDLKAYVVGELAQREKMAVEDHVRACQNCHDELDRLNLTRSALASLEDEEMPRRIAFVSDRVFEPRWWQTMWRSGPALSLIHIFVNLTVCRWRCRLIGHSKISRLAMGR